MNTFVGIDLAWKAANRTGLATVDDAGRLSASAVARGDDEIAEWLAVHAPAPVVVGIDAPLVVPNATGQRLPERLIGRAFGRYGASAHASNRANPMFDPPRAQVLAQRFGWSVDPDTATGEGRPVCLEVYPHPAMVGLFRLPKRIAYKKGPIRRAEMLRLLGHMEAIPELRLPDSARWGEVVRTVADPAPGDLDRVEDEIDGIFCAHLAWLWHHRPGTLIVYGSLADGYIVAPPEPTVPSARLQ